MRPKVLVVDDEVIVLRSCRAVLEAEGCEVLSAGSVAEALPVITAQVPVLLLVDVKMPVQDGMYLMRRLNELGLGLPVVVMSGYSTAETIQEAQSLGAVAFISKPFTPDELADTVRSVLETLEKEEGHGQQENPGD
jgi:DNA-binding NtrC family response regulator